MRTCYDPASAGGDTCPGDSTQTRLCERGPECNKKDSQTEESESEIIEVQPSSGTECSEDRVCAMKTSCPYWLERELSYKEGQDDTFLTDARAQICNVPLRALCCPLSGEEETGEVPTTPRVPPSQAQPGVIITGGDKRSVGVSVSVYNPHSARTCHLEDLPGASRSLHTICGGLLCGGKVCIILYYMYFILYYNIIR